MYVMSMSALVVLGVALAGQTQGSVPMETTKARIHGAARTAPEPQRIEFRIRTKHEIGKVRCGLYDTKKDWLSTRYIARATAEVDRHYATCIFFGLPPGRYAASAYHDKDDDGELDRNFLGIPSEDYAFTSGAKAGLRPPSFEDADFDYDGGTLHLSGEM